ncbi:MAG TPA: hypothetical protein PLE19_15925 [Planctomycetota bacterium]|nr:hypothetical protein [Planctomycetota bacterium]HRR81590.1 hypothetical protein [Planctomycetota bacterium]HRT94857.1 hypothetical protein [Planctomycetota bacterium]
MKPAIALIVSLAALGAEPEAPNLDLAGAWADGAGAILFFQREGKGYVGTLLGAEERRETIRVERTGPGVYKGSVEMRREDNGKAEAAGEIEITVQGDTFTSVRAAEKGKTTSVARRLTSEGERRPPKAKAEDPGDIGGVWRAANGDTTRYERKDDRYLGRVVALAPDRKLYGFRIGEENVRLRRVSGGYYVGKVLVKSEGGVDAWWDDIEVTVAGDELKYRHYLKAGGSARGAARRLPGPVEEPEPERVTP